MSNLPELTNPFAVCPGVPLPRFAHVWKNALRIVDKSLLREWLNRFRSGKVGGAVIGAGWMGTVVAARYAALGIPVCLVDTNKDACQQALVRIGGLLPHLGVVPSPPSFESLASRIRFVDDLSDLPPVLFVAEFVTESIARKRRVLAELEAVLPPATPIISGSSAIPVAFLAACLRHPERLVNCHFFHPLYPFEGRRPAELVVSGKTLPDAIAAGIVHILCQRCVPVLVPDEPGFLANRLLFAYLRMAVRLLAWGVSPGNLESSTSFLGNWWQPLRRLDEIGLDTALRVGRLMAEPTTGAVHLPAHDWELLAEWVARGHTGRKVGRGFYLYGVGQEKAPELIADFEAYLCLRRPTKPVTPAFVVAALVLALAGEAESLLTKWGWEVLDVVDFLASGGLRLPRWTGGLTRWLTYLEPGTALPLFQQVMEEGLCEEKAVPSWEKLRASRWGKAVVDRHGC
ncbi:MAG: 3-hydroxyacyl-CoA dehydrogenase family protein [Thermoguttaceae bacterium]|nr:3-hydroxyacyl-CoA dehydrogenase family protein [Thermoguttaceae bacterium]MDW8077704.1 3-hydroxyacyl-CoA dehydrogenase family protein [Thermoguttaceae bacterium]